MSTIVALKKTAPLLCDNSPKFCPPTSTDRDQNGAEETVPKLSQASSAPKAQNPRTSETKVHVSPRLRLSTTAGGSPAPPWQVLL